MNILLIIIVCIIALAATIDAVGSKTVPHKVASYIFSVIFCIMGIVIVRGGL